MPQGVIFDMDGLMLESEDLWSEVDRLVLKHYGAQYDPALKQLFMGCEKLESARRFCEAYKISDTPEAVARKRSELAREFYRSLVRTVPGLEALVKDLRTRGKLLAVATSAEREILSIVQARFPIFQSFQALVCAGDVKHGKPAPDLFLEAAARLGVTVRECLVLEDSPNGVEAALAAGMKVIAIPNPAVRRESVKSADWMVSRLTDVTPELIDRICRNDLGSTKDTA